MLRPVEVGSCPADAAEVDPTERIRWSEPTAPGNGARAGSRRGGIRLVSEQPRGNTPIADDATNRLHRLAMSSDENLMDRTATAGPVVRRTTWTDYEYPSTAVVEAVADTTGRDQRDLEKLQTYVDGDALDALLTGPGDGRLEVTFRYGDVDVHVRASGDLEVWLQI